MCGGLLVVVVGWWCVPLDYVVTPTPYWVEVGMWQYLKIYFCIKRYMSVFAWDFMFWLWKKENEPDSIIEIWNQSENKYSRDKVTKTSLGWAVRSKGSSLLACWVWIKCNIWIQISSFLYQLPLELPCMEFVFHFYKNFKIIWALLV